MDAPFAKISLEPDPTAEASAEARKQCELAYQFCPGIFTQYALAAVRIAERTYSVAGAA